MDILVLMGYVALLIVIVALMGRTAKRSGNWLLLWLLELCAAVGAWAVMMIADAAPGAGPLAALHNFGIVIYSMGAAGAYAILLVISLIIGLTQWVKQNREENP